MDPTSNTAPAFSSSAHRPPLLNAANIVKGSVIAIATTVLISGVALAIIKGMNPLASGLIASGLTICVVGLVFSCCTYKKNSNSISLADLTELTLQISLINKENTKPPEELVRFVQKLEVNWQNVRNQKPLETQKKISEWAQLICGFNAIQMQTIGRTLLLLFERLPKGDIAITSDSLLTPAQIDDLFEMFRSIIK